MKAYLVTKARHLVIKNESQAYIFWRVDAAKNGRKYIIDRYTIEDKKITGGEALIEDPYWEENFEDYKDAAQRILNLIDVKEYTEINPKQYLTHPKELIREMIREILNESV